MADVEASVTSASCADGSGCRVPHDKLTLLSSKALRSSSVQVMGWEPLTLGPERIHVSSYTIVDIMTVGNADLYIVFVGSSSYFRV
jgi:hypothetical protein